VFSILSLPSRLALHNEFQALNVVRVNGFDYALHKYFPSRFRSLIDAVLEAGG